MNELNWNKTLAFVNLIMGAIYLGFVTTIFLGQIDLNKHVQISLLLMGSIIFFRNTKTLSKIIEEERGNVNE